MTTQREPVSVTSWLLPTLAHSLILLGMLARLVYSVPHYQKTFADFNMALPSYTVWVLDLSRWLVLYWYVAVVPVFGLIAADAFLLWRMGGWRARSGCRWAWGVMGSLLSLWVLIELALWLPMMKLLDELKQ
jgi:type II secretory pathway component PulF